MNANRKGGARRHRMILRTRSAGNPFRIRYALPALAGMLAVIVAALASFHPHIAQSHPAGVGGPFSLTDGDGQTVTDKSWPGKYLLIYFGYTSCPDVCPTTLNNLAGALADLGTAGDAVQPIFITVDPQRDTAKAIGAYTKAFSPRLVGLTGSADQIAQVAKEFRVYYAREATGPNPADYGVSHSSLIYLMGPDGQFVAPITADQPPDAMAAQIRSHLS